MTLTRSSRVLAKRITSASCSRVIRERWPSRACCPPGASACLVLVAGWVGLSSNRTDSALSGVGRDLNDLVAAEVDDHPQRGHARCSEVRPTGGIGADAGS